MLHFTIANELMTNELTSHNRSTNETPLLNLENFQIAAYYIKLT